MFPSVTRIMGHVRCRLARTESSMFSTGIDWTSTTGSSSLWTPTLIFKFKLTI